MKINFKMVLLHTDIYFFIVIAIFNSLGNCSPSGMFDKLRRGRGIFVPEPRLMWLYNVTTEDLNISPATTESPTTHTKKKWQVGRVSRRHYEIVNMILRKTKIFLDVETLPPTRDSKIKKYINNKPLTPTSLRSKLQPTESYIEFYYLEENDKHNKYINRSARLSADYIKNHPGIYQSQLLNPNNFKPLKNNSPILAFRVNEGTPTKSQTTTTRPTSLFQVRKHRSNLPYIYLKPNYDNKSKSLWDIISFGYVTAMARKQLRGNTFVDEKKHETCPLTTETITDSTPTTIKGIEVSEDYFDTSYTYTTIYDKIKFFEIYDRQTRNIKKFADSFQDNNNNLQSNPNASLKDSNNVEKILLEHVDVGFNHHDNKFAKKHVSRDTLTYENKSSTPMSLQAIDDIFPQMEVKNSNYSLLPTVYEKATHDPYSYSDMSKAAPWSDFPFAAVYIYEPSQVFCDAAAISKQWLITAGSCLSRQHHLEPSTFGRSAYVTYCGAAWRQPERIAYVKYTLVHPKFHQQKRKRRFLFNIGVIQVASSLISACPDWAPVTLISHQFATNSEMLMASAVGWGLDRYAAKYPDSEIPSHSLKVYNGQIHSDDCPGNIGYFEAKQVEPLNVMKNVYCLSLPPYKNEELDPVHGSLLLVGGKLVALYLQEERRLWGEQSAMYTGIWRLIPWLLEVAREPEDMDPLTAEI